VARRRTCLADFPRASSDVRYFRFPYLRYGKRPRAQGSGDAIVGHPALPRRTRTAATSGVVARDYYQVAIDKHRADLAARSPMLTSTTWWKPCASVSAWRKQRLGAKSRQITLFHVNRLAADHLGDALAALKKEGCNSFLWEQALADPFTDWRCIHGGCGCSWLARIEPPYARGEYAFGDYEDQLRARSRPYLGRPLRLPDRRRSGRGITRRARRGERARWVRRRQRRDSKGA